MFDLSTVKIFPPTEEPEILQPLGLLLTLDKRFMGDFENENIEPFDKNVNPR